MPILCKLDCDDSALVTAIQIQLADAMMTRIFLTTSRPVLRTSWNPLDKAVLTAVSNDQTLSILTSVWTDNAHHSLLLGTLNPQRAAGFWLYIECDLNICFSLEAGRSMLLSL